MKLRFLAAAGPQSRLRALELDSGLCTDASLRKVHHAHGLALWAPPDTPVIQSQDGRSVLVGLLFDRSSARRLSILPAAVDPAAPVLRDCWGAYALFVTGNGDPREVAAEPPSLMVLRDPSASIPVYYGKAAGLDLYASDADLLARLWPGRFQADLHFIRQWLTYPYLRTSRTGAAGVRELPPGSCRECSAAGEKITESWSPAAHAGPAGWIHDRAEAAALLREEALRTIPCLAPPGEKAALQLSGGLDSSIVAAALHHAGRPFSAITFATRGADGDERRFAREVAEYCGAELLELVEEEWSPCFEAGSASPLRPPANPLLQPLHRAVSLQLTLTGSGLLLDGAGGDNVFAYLKTASPVLDAFRSNGAAQAWRALRNVADLHGCTIWTAARFAMRRARRPATLPWPAEAGFLSADAAAPEALPHPWLSPRPGILPGTADQIRMIAGIHHFLPDPLPGTPATLHPLLAQPLLELCLRIPTWLWIAGGRDRSVARDAFEGLLPKTIVQRRGKGRLESMYLKGYALARPRLQSFLLEGRLAAAGLLDRDAIAAYLSEEETPRDPRYIRLLEIAAAEQWLRSFGR